MQRLEKLDPFKRNHVIKRFKKKKPKNILRKNHYKMATKDNQKRS